MQQLRDPRNRQAYSQKDKQQAGEIQPSTLAGKGKGGGGAKASEGEKSWERFRAYYSKQLGLEDEEMQEMFESFLRPLSVTVRLAITGAPLSPSRTPTSESPHALYNRQRGLLEEEKWSPQTFLCRLDDFYLSDSDYPLCVFRKRQFALWEEDRKLTDTM